MDHSIAKPIYGNYKQVALEWKSDLRLLTSSRLDVASATFEFFPSPPSYQIYDHHRTRLYAFCDNPTVSDSSGGAPSFSGEKREKRRRGRDRQWGLTTREPFLTVALAAASVSDNGGGFHSGGGWEKETDRR
ncbi:hypothetical protein L2E82_25205 [Cichorium intybus]|uniref:Uncharacterized protein n=1 Tax=Cichorium intybus TaxID=13427 RepID=A0ACB9E2C7_CICIN|nr:hypothetical protein L2E82_25205 [Cichorium intybus]